MNLQKLNLKIFIANPETVQFETFIPIFHRWIQEQNMSDLLLDVADYQHVPSGPGIMLIAQNANYSIDNAQNRLGFLYNQKTVLEGNNPDKLKKLFQTTLLTCQKLEQEETLKGKLKFLTNEMQFILNDRLNAPNTEETFQKVKGEISSFLNSFFGENNYSLHRHSDPRERFTLEIKTSASFSLDELLKKSNYSGYSR